MTRVTLPLNRHLCRAWTSRCVDTDRYVSIASIITLLDGGNLSLQGYYILNLQLISDGEKGNEGVTKLNNLDLHDDVIFTVLIKSKRMERARHLPFTGEKRNTHTILF